MNWTAIAATFIVTYIMTEICCYVYVNWLERSIPYELAWFFRFASRLWEPSICGCKSCNISTRLVNFHDTWYKEWDGPHEFGQLEFFPESIVSGGGKSITLLCEHCWQTSPPEQQLQYFIDFFHEHPRDIQTQQLIIDAVLAGK